MNAKINLKKHMPFIWVIFILITLVFVYVTAEIEMPYDKWISENLPVWLAIINYIIFGTCLVVLAIPTRSVRANYIACTIGLLSALFLKASHPKAPAINSTILFISGILFLLLKNHYGNKK